MRTTAKLVTTTQIFQMVFGLFVSLWAGFQALYGTENNAICEANLPCPCRFNVQSFIFSTLMYLTYLILFLNFANNAYALKLRCYILMKKLKAQITKAKSAGNNNAHDYDIGKSNF